VDDDIASVGKLLDLANTLKKVPTQNITFLTMPTVPYAPDHNRVSPDTDLDDQIFSLLAHDQSVTGPSTVAATGAGTTPGTPSPTPTATSSALSPSAVTDPIIVENGTTNDGRSRQLASTLHADGFKNTSGVSYNGNVDTTTVFYSSPAHQAAAQAGGDGSAPIVVRVGSDFATGDVYNPGAASSSSAPSALPSAALSSADGENAADPNLCVSAAGS
jgi:hypothetical protein